LPASADATNDDRHGAALKAKVVAALAAMGDQGPVGRPMEQQEQSEHLPDASIELRGAEN
jgi:hypothetical protein